MDLALDNLQRLICHKTQTTDQMIFISIDYIQLTTTKTIKKLTLFFFSSHATTPRAAHQTTGSAEIILMPL